MKYNPEKHHRRSIRLKGYDYSQAGFYFVTICCYQRQRNYYEHIIRNEESLNKIREYIVNNSLSWQLDQLNPNNPSKW